MGDYLRRYQQERENCSYQLKPAPPALLGCERLDAPGCRGAAPQAAFIPQQQQAEQRADGADDQQGHTKTFAMPSLRGTTSARRQQRGQSKCDAYSAQAYGGNTQAFRRC